VEAVTWIEAAFVADHRPTSAMRHALAASDVLVDEFLAAAEYVLGAPISDFRLAESPQSVG
jgi:FMN-dependent NADH-azoreductase